MTVWETLGIEPTNEQAAIKRAYAARLKQVRPDEDPAGFQALREARDEALYLSAYLDDEGKWQDDDWDEDEFDENSWDAEIAEDGNADEDNSDQGNSEQNNQQEADDSPASQTITAADPAPRADEPAPLIPEPPILDPVEQSPGTPQLETGQPTTSEPASSPATNLVPNHAEASVLIDLRQSPDQAESTPQEPGTTEPPEDPEPSDEAELSYEQIDEKLELLTGPWGNWQLASWQPFIDQIREQSFEITDYAERRILYAVSDQLSENPPASEEEKARQHAIISLLDEAFGWHQNDRRVHNLLGNDAADQLMNRIRWRNSTDEAAAPREFYDAIGFPVLSAQEFSDYLGKADTAYEQYYQRCLEAGHKYINAWCWPGFLFGPLWLAHRCNDGIEALTGIGYTIGIVLLIYGVNNTGSILGFVGLLILASLHLMIGFYGKRILIGTMATAYTELEMDSKLSEKKRQEKLKKLGQGGSKAIFETIIGNLGIGIIIITILAFFTGG